LGAYFGSKLSPHIVKNPAGFLICKDVAIARTGTQQYLGREIGVSDRPNDIITVYRVEEEVFNPRAMASFEGCPFTEEHPMDFVQPNNSDALVKGTIVNVHRGTGNSRDLLLADIIIYGKQEIDFVESKEKREISCGYECEYVPYKDGFKQVNIIGNHVALVSAGRAGQRVAIQDTAKVSLDNKNIERSKRMGYRIPRKSNVSDFVKAVGLKTLAADAEPEEVQEMVEGLVDEKHQAEKDAEPIIIEPEVEPDTHDEEISELKEQIQNVKDAIYAMLDSDEEEVEEVAEDEETGVEALDELESEFISDEDMLEEVQSVEEDDEDINEIVEENDACDEDETEITTDSILELARVIKPIIASVPDVNKRKKMSDSLAKVLRKHAKKASDSSSNSYAKMLNRTKDSEIEQNIDLGKEIAKKYNPHYKEVK